MSDTLKANPKYPILDIQIANESLKNWQLTTDLIADLIDVPAALIMRVHAREIEVFVSSHSKDNVYEHGEKAPLDSGLYCDTVMLTRKELLIPNALKDPEWDHNPDIALGMISYYGLPLTWPSGAIFGTFCVLDIKENAYSQTHLALIERFRDSIQLNLVTIYENHEKTILTHQAQEHAYILSQALEQCPVAVEIIDLAGKIEYVNQASEAISGFSAHEVLGEVADIFAASKISPSAYSNLWQKTAASNLWQGEMQTQKKNGELFWKSMQLSPIVDNTGKLNRFLVLKKDINTQKQQEEQIIYQALYDSLTELPNRVLI